MRNQLIIQVVRKLKKKVKEGEKITLLGITEYMRILGNEAAKTVLEDNLLPTNKCPPPDLINWIKTEAL
jgi:hypothetical protein